MAALTEITLTACAQPRAEVLSFFDAFEHAGKQTKGAQTLDLSEFYCDDQTCPAIIGGVNVYRDRSHLSVTYVETMTPFVYQKLVGLGALTPPQ